MTTMVEKVARAIWESHELGEFDTASIVDRGFHLNAARAAIEAMMEPTPGMLAAGEDEDTFMANGVLVERSDAAHHYVAMIQAALKEGQ